MPIGIKIGSFVSKISYSQVSPQQLSFLLNDDDDDDDDDNNNNKSSTIACSGPVGRVSDS